MLLVSFLLKLLNYSQKYIKIKLEYLMWTGYLKRKEIAKKINCFYGRKKKQYSKISYKNKRYMIFAYFFWHNVLFQLELRYREKSLQSSMYTTIIYDINPKHMYYLVKNNKLLHNLRLYSKRNYKNLNNIYCVI